MVPQHAVNTVAAADPFEQLVEFAQHRRHGAVHLHAEVAAEDTEVDLDSFDAPDNGLGQTI